MSNTPATTRRRIKTYRNYTEPTSQEFSLDDRMKNEGPRNRMRLEMKRSISLNSGKRLQASPRQKSTAHTELSPLKHDFSYNKWYIEPRVRMKRSLLKQIKPLQKDPEFAYNRLYEEVSLVKELPFVAVHNKKFQLLEKIPANNFKLLEGFKKKQQSQRKRVPRIVQLFLKKKTEFN